VRKGVIIIPSSDLIIAGMTHQGWDLQLTAHGGGHWRATFYVAGMAHSIVGGSAGSLRHGGRCGGRRGRR